ncbi:Uncharacterized protein Rs2_47893 [Raphanus sativus]|nr:Uncharacterized protein Rs2_47893 [Raphanus sativus]
MRDLIASGDGDDYIRRPADPPPPSKCACSASGRRKSPPWWRAHGRRHAFGFITKDKLKEVMKSMAELWEMMIGIYIDGNGDIYNGFKTPLRNIQSVRWDSFTSKLEISRRQVQEVVTVRDQLEKKEQDPGLSNQSERRRSEKFATLKQINAFFPYFNN